MEKLQLLVAPLWRTSSECRSDKENQTGHLNSGSERDLWRKMTPEVWKTSVSEKDSIFNPTYEATRGQIEREVEAGGHDVVIEVGCGTGDVIGELNVSVPCYGLDINEDFIDHCKRAHDHCEFVVQDAMVLMEWWNKFNGKYKKPLVTCVNNTLNIMPAEIRGQAVDQMIQVVGSSGRCLVTYWNGRFFSHALMSYYKENEELCGSFDVHDHVNWDSRRLLTTSGYSTEWMLPHEVQSLMRSYDVDVSTILPKQQVGTDHINTEELSIFLWFSEASTSRAKSYYDSDDAQKFYSNIWGEHTVHIGRYDLLTPADKQLTKHKQIALAQEIHEEAFVELIKAKLGDQKIRIVDFGCGYGGLLRRLWQAKMVWTAVGCDIAGKMCEQARRLNETLGCDTDIGILEESYLDVSVPSASADLVISMDALLHVGPERQHRAIQEAARILRPGGWLIFTDIMENEVVDPVKMQPIYDRIHLSKLGTVSNYKDAMERVGFTEVEFQEHSSNVSAHYGTIREVLLEKGQDIGLSQEYQQKMESGLQTWRDLAPQNIQWGFMIAQKTEKVSTI